MNGPVEWLHHARHILFGSAGQDPQSAPAEILRTYLSTFNGRYFERLYDQRNPHRFTSADLLAVTALSVVVPPKFVHQVLIGKELKQAEDFLKDIDIDLRIEDLSPSAYEKTLGKGSPAWNLWEFLDQQPGIGSTIAGKLMAAKRPHLIPISDSYVKAALGTTERDMWKCMWTVLADEEIRNGLGKIRSEVAEARDLSLLRVLDIVAWQYGKRM